MQLQEPAWSPQRPVPGQTSSSMLPLGGGPFMVDLSHSPELPSRSSQHLANGHALPDQRPPHNPWNPPASSPSTSKRSYSQLGGSDSDQGPVHKQRMLSSPPRPGSGGSGPAPFSAHLAVPRGFRAAAAGPLPQPTGQQHNRTSNQQGVAGGFFAQPSAGAAVNGGWPGQPQPQAQHAPAAAAVADGFAGAGGGQGRGALPGRSSRKKRGRPPNSSRGRGRGRGRSQ